MFNLVSLCKNAKISAGNLLKISEDVINKALISAGELLVENAEFLKENNDIDIENAIKNGKNDAFIDRLRLSDKVIFGMAEGLKQVAKLNSPLNKTVYTYENLEQGIRLEKTTVPFGVIGIIFESRPNVSADAFALCLKTKNAVILRGGSDAINSNNAIVTVLKKALEKYEIDVNAISLITDTSRETAKEFMKMKEYVDLLIPRGGASLIRSAIENSTIPIIETGLGNCHVYIDEFADFDKAISIVFNAKTHRYGVCNACESLVIHSKIIDKILPLIYNKLQEKQVQMRLDERSFDVLRGKENVIKATDEDFKAEYCDAIISVKTVDSIDQAIEHINLNSTHHSEAIVTENQFNAELFLKTIDSTSVYHNASTRFTDGFVFGLGAEIGISTQKMHARGPMGLEQLTTTKFTVKDITGKGAIRK